MLKEPDKPVVYLAIPARPGEGIKPGLWSATQPENMGSGFTLYDANFQPNSLLTTNFNILWCRARAIRICWYRGKGAFYDQRTEEDCPFPEDGDRECQSRRGAWLLGWQYGSWENDPQGPEPRRAPTHFVMVHSDISPEPKWLGKLVAIYQRVGAEFLSVVIPLKDESGGTSTAVMNMHSEQMKVLTLRECLESLPSTFNIQDCANNWPGVNALLTNTGLWIADLRLPFARKVCFRIYDTIVETAQGLPEARAVGEDYLLGVDLARLGVKVFCTTEVAVKHIGEFGFPNNVAFGTQKGFEAWGSPWCIEPPTMWKWQDSESKAIHHSTISTELPAHFQLEEVKP